jgi:hypothetical protein
VDRKIYLQYGSKVCHPDYHPDSYLRTHYKGIQIRLVAHQIISIITTTQTGTLQRPLFHLALSILDHQVAVQHFHRILTTIHPLLSTSRLILHRDQVNYHNHRQSSNPRLFQGAKSQKKTNAPSVAKSCLPKGTMAKQRIAKLTLNHVSRTICTARLPQRAKLRNNKTHNSSSSERHNGLVLAYRVWRGRLEAAAHIPSARRRDRLGHGQGE